MGFMFLFHKINTYVYRKKNSIQKCFHSSTINRMIIANNVTKQPMIKNNQWNQTETTFQLEA